ncbi:unnamed protein product [Nesidiocoris tenuis]|uniref:Uncharacterized protein n=1 Tax=Nesidiocoris tenuis TaxID=355587 RepID=A0A6H5H205_9HEMI|nr:unnamed protein product [Nesidiocoris tenuis]
MFVSARPNTLFNRNLDNAHGPGGRLGTQPPTVSFVVPPPPCGTQPPSGPVERHLARPAVPLSGTQPARRFCCEKRRHSAKAAIATAGPSFDGPSI